MLNRIEIEQTGPHGFSHVMTVNLRLLLAFLLLHITRLRARRGAGDGLINHQQQHQAYN